ncbi:DUF2934 domain-containing protein [Ciceribacter thiooxidans]|uniref:DUF2934 domain-containing protein n=1 Tax=Ciceribacter thiooxidans TaxID=1969821 RepID=A0ABV7I9J4_9HYPH
MQKQDRDEHVRSRAYEIWEQEGRPDGEHERHWRQASEEFEAGLAASAEATDLPCGAEGLATGLQPGSVTPGGGPGRGADSIGVAGKGTRGTRGVV